MTHHRKMRPRGLTIAETFAWFMPGEAPPPDTCWPWTASTKRSNSDGQFGMHTNGRYTVLSARRTAYQLYNGPIDDGTKIRVTCNNGICCQPAHLYAGNLGRKPYIPKIRTPEQRFWKRVNQDGPIDPHLRTPCWIWLGVWDGQHNPKLELTVNGKTVSALRFSYQLAGHTIPPGKKVYHRCPNNQICVNPDHLRIAPAIETRGRAPGPTWFEAGVAANQQRTRQAAERRITAATKAIPIIRRSTEPPHLKTRHLRVLTARITNPHATLAELGAQLGMTKDAYAGALRRATEIAETPKPAVHYPLYKRPQRIPAHR